ncbi:ABC transporter permease [Haloimpatiens lingqiaonensis]|uniref:ABC transporter permease n=1 Tax=Haloimpatiens lingqiaonensis TaxID=1380675 RepID=UPI0010FE7DB2|nr:ABC transporter permease subunit [Haloimpatiens lingqiaonensis]
MEKIKINPILRKETKVRMRTWRAPFLLAIYIGILTFIAAFALFNTIFAQHNQGFNYNDITTSYAVLAGIQFLLIAFIIPALTSSAISNERERQTLDLLLCTKLKPSSIIIGKLITSISQILLLIVSSLPVFSIIFLFGGISIKEIAQLLGYYIILAVTFGSIGMFFSTYIKKTTTSTVLTYGTILFLMLGTLIISAFYVSIKYRYNPNPTIQRLPLMYFNPGAGFVSMVMEQFGKGSSIGIPGIVKLGPLPFWAVNMIIDIIISVVMLSLSIYKLDPMKKKRAKS